MAPTNLKESMTVEQLAANNAEAVWYSADNNTLGAWDFGNDEQFPALNYADYDGPGTVFACSQFPADACGTLLPFKPGVKATGLSAVAFSATTTITGSLFGRGVVIESWSWVQLQGPTVTLTGADTRMATFRAPADGDFLEFELTAMDSGGNEYTDRILISLGASVDPDGDGLIEIDSLTMLHNMRHNLTGSSYRERANVLGAAYGCPAAGCRGYELTGDLNFDSDGDGTTWSGNAEDGFTLDPGDSQPGYFLVNRNRGTGGWSPIGDLNNPFATEFNGNGHSISNLAIRRDQYAVGLFGVIGRGAAIRNLGLIGNLADYSGSRNIIRPIGGLAGRQLGGSITASYATGTADGGAGGLDYVGGLVGHQSGGMITASYATGAADGGDGSHDSVGGLVGELSGGSITASYAMGDADGGNDRNDRVGGLVGHQVGGMITASYATGAAAGGDGNIDKVGGLVGFQNGGSITASYATAVADGGGGDFDQAGGLVGVQQGGGKITASYGFGEVKGERKETKGLDGSPKPQGVKTAVQLTADNAEAVWDSADNNTLGAWDFGNDEQFPALNYADYDGTGTVFACSQFPAGACGTFLPLKAGVKAAAALSAVEFGAITTITGSLPLGRGVTITAWIWKQLQGSTVTLMGATSSIATFRAPDIGTLLLFELVATDSDGNQYTDSILISVGASVDHDGNGLIDIDSLMMLHNMRHNLTGTSYRESADAPGAAHGCPVAGCRGYELTENLDFDTNGNGTWSGNAEDGFTLDPDDSQAGYFRVNGDAGGWRPIGDFNYPFVAEFDGNDHTISNLAIRRDQTYIGLFGVIGEGAAIRNLGLIDNLADYTGYYNFRNYIGGLVGRQDGASITASYATGVADGGSGNFDLVGGLVGGQIGGLISASYATGDADGGDGDNDQVGGLVGWQSGLITESHAEGAVGGGNGRTDNVGGLVGRQFRGLITASYATGAADGGDGHDDQVGGLVGWQVSGLITASYARGAADGGDGPDDHVGGLVGRQESGLITASYARGAADGGEGEFDYVGGLVGWQEGGSITASYATGAADGGGGGTDRAGGLVGGQTGGSITASYATGAAVCILRSDSQAGALVGWQRAGSIAVSYGFGEVTGDIQGKDGSDKPEGVTVAGLLTAANAGTAWGSADSNTLGAWDFDTDTLMLPALKYADYDGTGTVFVCSQFPADACGTLLPGQRGDVPASNGDGSGPSGSGSGGGGGGGGGSLGTWALVALALPPLLCTLPWVSLRRRRQWPTASATA